MALNLEWANNVRFSMVNDPGRQSFQDQIQLYGFHFLDDYLDNILSKPKQDSALIDLVKTPSRKRAISHKSKANPSPSKLKNLVTLDDDSRKENSVPLNGFHKALLKAKDEELSRPIPAPFQPFQPLNGRPQYDDVPDEPISPGPSRPSIVEPSSNETDAAQHNSGPIELSMIMEDDEPSEKSRRSLQVNSTSETKARISDLIVPESHPVVEPDAMAMDVITSSSADTFHSIPLASPRIPSPPPPFKSPVLESLPVVKPAAPEHPIEPEFHDVPQAMETAMSSSLAETESHAVPHAMEKAVSPPPAESESRDVPPAVHDDQVNAPEEIGHVSLYPTLPAPLPLRKSMKAPRDPSVGAALSNPTPGPPVGKRTSWLAKARQVNALDHGVGRQTGGNHTGSFGTVTAKRKSEDFFGPTTAGAMRQDNAERNSKAAKEKDVDVAPLKATVPEKIAEPTFQEQQPDKDSHGQDQEEVEQSDQQLGMLDHFKKTVEGLGARFGKSMGKSMGGQAVANALAEARAAAEARVAERNNDEVTRALGPAMAPSRASTPPPKAEASSSKQAVPESPTRGRLSVSDLFLSEEKPKAQKKEMVFQLVPPQPGEKVKSSEGPESQTFDFAAPFGKVFDKPTPVFAPPTPAPPKEKSPTSVFSKPVSMSVGLSPRLQTVKSAAPLTAHSTFESVRTDASEQLFGSQESPAWMPSTQDTEYDFETQSQSQRPLAQFDDGDDDSWRPLNTKLQQGDQWEVPITYSEGDSMTWSSSNPTQTHRLETEDLGAYGDIDETNPPASTIPGSFHMDVDDIDDDEVDIGASKSTVSLVDPSKIIRSETAMSMSSTSSGQSSNVGFFGQASKLVSSVLGSSKKAKPEVKSLQLAAAAAKKGQEEKEKKAAVMKNMENRRQQVLQKKAEEEKARKQEAEKKIKEEVDRRKREREELTDKRPLKLNASTNKKDDEPPSKTRKIELKKPATKVPLTSNPKSTFRPALNKTPASAISQPPANSAATSSTAGPSNKALPNPVPVPQKSKGKAPAKGPVYDDDISQPSQMLQNQMAARAKAQLDAAQQSEPLVPSENIELPDINSEYSDSDDEDRVKTFDPPEWAQSPELRQALQSQSTINPDEIFGAVRPLRMEEIFKTRTSRFRARTSSANWNGSDRLTAEEEREYARRMGFQ